MSQQPIVDLLTLAKTVKQFYSSGIQSKTYRIPFNSPINQMFDIVFVRKSSLILTYQNVYQMVNKYIANCQIVTDKTNTPLHTCSTPQEMSPVMQQMLSNDFKKYCTNNNLHGSLNMSGSLDMSGAAIM